MSLQNSNNLDSFNFPNGQRIGSLLYADDLVLLSRSQVGLQNCINLVHDFCNKWKMSVNEKKSKIMIFSKKETDKIKQTRFTLNGNFLDKVKEFTYLGVKISSTGNFASHQIKTKEKALHAFYKITNKIDFRRLKPKLACKLFDSLIRPILTYSCEIWGVYQKHDFEKWDKNPIEKVQLRFCKYFLGVSNKASNIATRAELGRFPLLTFIDNLSFKYFNHLLSLPDNSYTKQALLISQSLHENNKSCYYTNLLQVSSFYNLDLNFKNIISNPNLEKNYNKMQETYFKHWKKLIDNSRKLCFYKTFKDFYEPEIYLDLPYDFEQRRQFTKFRISNHSLAIETGRYNNQNNSNDQRICLFCSNNEVETEIHMLCNCSLYNDIRQTFFSLLESEIPINNFRNPNTIHDLMISTNEKVLFYFSKFIYKCFILRNESQ